MTVRETHISDLLIIEPTIFSDDRGYFFESFRMSVLQERGIDLRFVQDNESKSNKGALRGLHLQAPPHGQAKLIRVVQGSIYDVVVDIRKQSPSYGQHFGLELNGQNKKLFFIPEGFAHGFCCLADDTIVQYKCSSYYSKDYEMGVMWNDPKLGIQWPVADPILSPKDQVHPPLDQFDSPY